MSIGEGTGRGLWGDPEHPDQRRHRHHDDYPTSGGNFNPGIKIDLSHASVAPPYTGPPIPDFSDMRGTGVLGGSGPPDVPIAGAERLLPFAPAGEAQIRKAGEIQYQRERRQRAAQRQARALVGQLRSRRQASARRGTSGLGNSTSTRRATDRCQPCCASTLTARRTKRLCGA
jgi:hypothetical protein